jgi:glycerophosphoryl diester phosphodiesterase
VLKTTGAVLGVSMASGVVGGQEGQDQTDQTTAPRITAHRGFRDVYPQNTVAAMSGSSAFDIDRIEIDVVATSDGEIVSFHDAKLDDLTDETGTVGETPAETVLEAEVLGSGETIPTLSETLAAVDPNITMNIEFKENGPLSWTEFGEQALAIADNYSGEYYVSSFDPDALRAVRDIDPEIDVGHLFGGNNEENLQLARELDAESVNVSSSTVNEFLVETAHGEDRDVNVYTIDSWRETRDLLELGVDGIIADFPHMAFFGTTSFSTNDR